MTPPSSLPYPKKNSALAGGFGAFFIWGCLPLYWAPLADVPSLEILAHRIFWSLLAIAPFAALTGRWPEVRAAMGSAGLMGRVGFNALCLGVNWCLYIWAITNGRVIEASLGYYINPLLNVLLGRLVLGERLTRLQILAVGLASFGVLWSVLAYGHFPWVALVLGLTFAVYGLARKTVAVESVPGLFLETLLLFPIAAGWLIWLHSGGQGHFDAVSVQSRLMLVGTGIVTTVPLLLFAHAARRLPLSTLGLLQYVAPTSTFLLGVFVFREPVTTASLATFCCIWGALAVYTWSGLRRMRGLPG